LVSTHDATHSQYSLFTSSKHSNSASLALVKGFLERRNDCSDEFDVFLQSHVEISNDGRLSIASVVCVMSVRKVVVRTYDSNSTH
jgi:hypothetical protein